MTEMVLVEILDDMYQTAPKGEQVAMIHLFGVTYADEIRSNGYKVSSIINKSSLNKSYATEISKGVKLSKYVIPKK